MTKKQKKRLILYKPNIIINKQKKIIDALRMKYILKQIRGIDDE